MEPWEKELLKEPKKTQKHFNKFVENVKANFDNEDAVLLEDEPNAIKIVKWLMGYEKVDVRTACYIYYFCDFWEEILSEVGGID